MFLSRRLEVLFEDFYHQRQDTELISQGTILGFDEILLKMRMEEIRKL